MSPLRKALLGLGVAGLAAPAAALGLAFAQPEDVVRGLERVQPGVVWSVDTDRRAVALTIDDGPSAYTPEILDLLHAYDAKATFFLIGERVAARPEAVRWIVAAGDEIGNHTVEERASVLMGGEEFARSLDRTDALLRPFGDPVWFRPGSGWYDAGMLETVRSRGYRTALASMLPLDGWIGWPALVSDYVLASARPGAVLVLHDGPRHGAATVRTLRLVLPELARRGYAVTTLGDLTASAR